MRNKAKINKTIENQEIIQETSISFLLRPLSFDKIVRADSCGTYSIQSAQYQYPLYKKKWRSPGLFE